MNNSHVDTQAIINSIELDWQNTVLPTLQEYIKIPCKSPMFDPNWQANGHLDKAIELFTQFIKSQSIKGLTYRVERLPGRTPIILVEIPGDSTETILLYGHLDKQPEMIGWDEDLGPWQPVIKDNKLYGRGGADDGYALFSALTAISAIQKQGLSHARCLVLIEACEESGSYDLPYYMRALKDVIGTPSLVICLDSGAGNYEQLWSTTSLRGVLTGNLTVSVLSEGVHSGLASGVVPSSFRIMRELLARIENMRTGEILIKDLHVDIPRQRIEQAKAAADVLTDNIYKHFPFLQGVTPVTDNLLELMLNKTWRPALEIIGADGFPATVQAGNVLRPSTTAKLSIRVPPTCDVEQANRVLKQTLEQDPPYNAKVEFHLEPAGPGWNAPALADWLNELMADASQTFFNKPAVYMGEGASIPFMGMLGAQFPKAQFLITGVLGPQSNAHGPNEFLHITYAKKLTCCVAQIIAKHHMLKK